MYRLIPDCISVLRSDVIPVTIRSIFDSKVIDGNCERKMSYPEMEKLFLYFVSILEKSIMIKAMEYWRNFCDKGKLLSLIPSVDYSDPFICAYNYDGFRALEVACPSAFTNEFGKYISFMSVYKIREIIRDFVDRCSHKLKEVVRSRCSYICNNVDGAYDGLEEFRCRFNVLMNEEFGKMIAEEAIEDKISSFSKDMVVWNNRRGIEINKVLIFPNIIGYARTLLKDVVAVDICMIIKSFYKRLELSKRRLSAFSKLLLAAGDVGWINMHPADDDKALSIKKKFIAESRIVIKDKFSSMLREGYEFLDGTVIRAVGWGEISKNLFPIAQEAVRNLVDAEYEEMSNILSNARVVEDVDIFDGGFVGTRKATPKEISSILKIFADYVHCRNRSLFSRVWKKLVYFERINVSKGVGFGGDSELEGTKKYCSSVDPIQIIPVDNSDLLVDNSGKNESPVVVSASVCLLDKVERSRIVDIWGLYIHPDDSKMVFFIRKKFSIQIRSHLTKLFSGMLEGGAVLPSGRVLSDSSWVFVSSELLPIAIKSVDSIVKEQYVELGRSLSRTRVVDIDESDCSSCTIRKVTDDEKEQLLMRAVKFVDSRLRHNVRLSWLRVVSKDVSDVGYGYKEKSSSGVGREGSWGVKLRYRDNTDILRSRKKFSSKIREIVYNKFVSMLMNNHKFDDGNFIGKFSWLRISKKLSPIAKEEIKYILNDQREELEGIVSRSRVVVGSVDRELTNEEKSIVSVNVMKLVHYSLGCLFRGVWSKAVTSLRRSGYDAKDYAETDSYEVDTSNWVGLDKICREDDLAILNIRKKFSSDIFRISVNKYRKMIKERYEFSDGTFVGICSWKNISRKILPIISEEINPIVEDERTKINDVLLKSRAYVSPPNVYVADGGMRGLTPGERSTILEIVMKCVRRSLLSNLSRAWDKAVRLQSACLLDLREMDKLEFDNVRLEFIGILGPIVDEVVSDLGDKNRDIYIVISERSRNLFKEGGFFDRVESLLSRAKVVDDYGNDRFITDKEKRYVLKEFIDLIDSDRDSLIRKRVSNLNFISIPMQ